MCTVWSSSKPKFLLYCINPCILFCCSSIELERLNLECEGTLSRECNLEAVEARNILKVALASQVAVRGVRAFRK